MAINCYVAIIVPVELFSESCPADRVALEIVLNLANLVL